MSGSRLAACTAGLAGATALAALAGWHLDEQILRSLLPQSVPMNPATAVVLLCAAASLWLQRPVGKGSVAGRLLAIAVLGLGLWKLVAIVTGPDAGIDQFLFPEKVDATAVVPNRMAPNTAVCLALLGGSLFLVGQRRRVALAQVLALASGAIAFFAFLGHLYGLADLYRVAAFIPMAFNTAIALTVLSFGVLAIRPRDGIATVVTASGAGGYLARRLLPAAIALPAVLGALRLWGEHSGFYAHETGTLLFVVSSILLMAGLVWWTSRALGRLDRERQAAENALRDLNKELEAFSYSVSHDLRAPLRAIVGFSQALVEDHASNLDESGQRLLGRIVGAGQRMGALIDDLLAFSRLSRADLRRQPVDLTRMTRDIESALREADTTRDVEIVVAEGLRAKGDPQLIRAALENLIGNAWKFTRSRPGARVELGASKQNGNPRTFFVRDNGAGFDMRYADKLFTPFQRLHAAAEFEGTGIGLATVQRIIERHGGRIWAEGSVGAGATFYFTLGEK